VFLFALIACFTASAAAAQSGKPALASEVKRLIDEKGAQAAMGDVMMLVIQVGTYENDEARMVALARDYTNAGDPDAAILTLQVQQMAGGRPSPDLHVALGDAYAAKGLDDVAGAEYLAALQQDPDHATAKARAVAAGVSLPAKASASPAARGGEPSRDDIRAWQNQGEPREDLARFRGRYRSVTDPNRMVAVYETCLGSGHLAAAPMWADVASWFLKSESDLVFSQPNPMAGVEPVRLRFEGAGPGNASAVTLTGSVEGRFERAGELEKGWQPEGDACYRPS